VLSGVVKHKDLKKERNRIKRKKLKNEEKTMIKVVLFIFI